MEMNLINMEKYFSATYQNARQRFLDSSAQNNAQIKSLILDARGPNDEELSIDIARFGSKVPESALIHVSGTHGVEAFAGSAIQLKMIEDLPEIPDNNAIIFVHVLNPYGMAWLRRYNENNVDLNRNFIEPPETWSGISDIYKKIDSFLNPKTVSFLDTYYTEAIINIIRYGYKALSQAIAGGQYEKPDGLFFGGKQLEQGPGLYKTWLKKNLSQVKRLFVIDVHTGLGTWQQSSLFHKLKGTDNRDFPDEIRKHIFTDNEDLNISGYRFKGAHANVYRQVFKDAKIDFFTQEFGTYSGVKVLKALRTENQYHHYGPKNINNSVKLTLKEAFYPNSEEWRKSVLQEGVEFFQLLFQLIHI